MNGAQRLLFVSVLVCWLIVGWVWASVDLVWATTNPIFQGKANHKSIALTFNVDWGQEYLPQILDVLKEQRVRATFFITGRWGEQFPELVRRIASEGHQIGNHGYLHLHVNQATEAQIVSDLRRSQAVLESIVGRISPFYAPPYGECEPHVVKAAESIGYQTVLWTIDTVDWREGAKASEIISKVTSRAQNGAIVLAHPTAVMAETLPGLIAKLKTSGYDLVTLSEIIS